MLVLTRKVGEAILIGSSVTVRVLEIKSNGDVKLGIDAPKHVNVLRDDLKTRLENDGVEVKMEKQVRG